MVLEVGEHNEANVGDGSLGDIHGALITPVLDGAVLPILVVAESSRGLERSNAILLLALIWKQALMGFSDMAF